MKKLFIVWGMLALLITISMPLSASASRQTEAKFAIAKKSALYKAGKRTARKVQMPPVVPKKSITGKNVRSGGTRVIYIHPKPPWYWNPFALIFIGAGIFLIGLISGRIWKMGPIPRPASECCGEETVEPKESRLQNFFGKFRKSETSHQLA